MTNARKFNLLDSLYNANVTTSQEDKMRMLKFSINALTAIACTSMMTHLFAQKRGEVGGIDERNEIDAIERGTELSIENMFDNGYTTRMPPLAVSRIANGIRIALYDELHRFGDFPSKHALYISPVVGITERPNYNLPMSAQLYMEFRGRAPQGVNESEVAQLVKRRNGSITADAVRAILLEDARKSAKRVADITPEVLAEITSCEDLEDETVNEVTGMVFPAHKPDAFTTLPLETQVQFAEKVRASLQRDFDRLLPRSLRDVEVAGECDLIELHIKSLITFVNEAEHTLAYDSQRLAA